VHYRDTTFFRVGDGTLTDYAMGVLIANAAWTAGKVLVLWCSRQAASATTKIHTYPRHTIHPRMQDWPVGAERAAIPLGRRGGRENDVCIQRLCKRGERAAVELEGRHPRARVGCV
jgi:hypothetical protein